MTNKYKEYIKSKEWLDIRLDIIQTRKCCERCGSKRQLQVHHKTYKNLFNEEPEDLELLCARCHMNEHGLDKNGKKKTKSKRTDKQREASKRYRKRKREKKEQERKKKKEAVEWFLNDGTVEIKNPLKSVLDNKRRRIEKQQKKKIKLNVKR